jgi:hypothetical protein
MIFVESKTVTIAVADKPKSDFKKPVRLMPRQQETLSKGTVRIAAFFTIFRQGANNGGQTGVCLFRLFLSRSCTKAEPNFAPG